MVFSDVITFCPDTAALLIDVEDRFPEFLFVNDETGKKSISPLTKTPSVRGPNGQTLALVRNPPAEIYELSTLTVLGTYDEVFADPAKLAVYDSVYDRTPRTLDDPETGEQLTITPPDKFGVFA